jgi:DNA primase
LPGIRDEDLQHIRERADLVDFVSEHVRLKKTGRTFRGLCPFHRETTPSFHIDPAKQLYHCFGCGAGGDLFTFLMKKEGFDFQEAVGFAARKIGYNLTFKTDPTGGLKSRLIKACETAAAFYQDSLNSDDGRHAREYLAKRGLMGLAGEFRLGLSPDWDSVIAALRKAGLSETEILKSGVGGRSARGKVYDRFKGRLIFPILDNQGRAIAFGGRVLDGSQPKYLNSPETPLYHKGSILYGLSQAKNTIIRQESAVVVEGYTDLLTLAGAGIANVVATLGTAFTEDHLRVLSRFAQRVVLVFDGDEAGLKAAERSSELIELQRLPGQEALAGLLDRVDMELVVVSLPDKLDPAEFVAANGAPAFAALLEGARPLLPFLIDRIIERQASKKLGKLGAVDVAGRLISGLKNAVAQEEYLRYLADKLDISYQALDQEIRRLKRPARNTAAAGEARLSPSTAGGIEREFIKLVLESPDRLSALGDVATEDWPDPALRRLGLVLKSITPGKAIAVNDILNKVDPELQSLISELLIAPEGATDSDEHFAQVHLKTKEAAVDRRIVGLKRRLEKTDSAKEEYNEIFAELVALEYQRRDIKKNAR